jgi:integrase
VAIVLAIVNAATDEDKSDPADEKPLAEPPENLARMPLGVFLEKVYFLERTLAETSRSQLLHTVADFERWAGREATIADLNRQTFNEYILAMAERYSPKTAQGRRANLISIWWRAFHNDYLNTRPERLRPVKVPRKFPEAWTIDELNRIVKAADELPGYLDSGIKRSAFYRAILLTGYDTGLRRSDLLALRRDQISDDGRVTIVMEKTGLTHECHVRPATLAAIRATFPPERELVFPWPHVERTLYIWLHAIMDAAGIPVERRGGFQRLRRTSASQLELVSPGMAGRHLGHLTHGLADKHYLDPRIVRRDVPMPPPLDA